MKRIFDIVLFLVGLTLLTAPAIITACVLKFGERHPVLFFQEPHLIPDECFRQTADKKDFVSKHLTGLI